MLWRLVRWFPGRAGCLLRHACAREVKPLSDDPEVHTPDAAARMQAWPGRPPWKRPTAIFQAMGDRAGLWIQASGRYELPTRSGRIQMTLVNCLAGPMEQLGSFNTLGAVGAKTEQVLMVVEVLRGARCPAGWLRSWRQGHLPARRMPRPGLASACAIGSTNGSRSVLFLEKSGVESGSDRVAGSDSTVAPVPLHLVVGEGR